MEDLLQEMQNRLEGLQNDLEISHMGQNYYDEINARIDEVEQVIDYINAL
jgi:hypothetical protein